jgi:hypothetical protein
LATGQGAQCHYALPHGRARCTSRSVRSLPSPDHLL